MDLAHCTLDGRDYRAEEFTALPADQFLTLKPWLICGLCGGKAGPVRPHHRVHHFRADHADDCVHDSGEREQIAAALPGGFDPNRSGRGFVLNLAPEPGPTVDVADDPAAPSTPGRARRHHPTDGEGEGPHHYMLETMLELLIARPDVAVSDEPITIGNETTICRHFFTGFDDTTPAHVGRYGGYWGPVESIGHRIHYSWINTPGEAPDVRVGRAARTKARTVEAALADAAVLVIGTPVQKENGEIEIQVDDAAAIALAGRGRRRRR